MEPPEQPEPLPPPGTFGPRREDHPGDRDGAPAIHDTDGQDDKPLPSRRRVNGQGQLRALPPPHHPSKQGGNASLDMQRLALRPPFA
jgi:hypothetical protein